MIKLGGIVNLKGMEFEQGKVYSNPFAKAFAPQITEAEGSQDHEVSMANNSLDTIIKMATELKAKMGENEKDIPAWIQDHITNAENFISQAASNYHEYGTNEGINEASYNFGKEEYTKKNLTPTQIQDLAFAYAQAPITKLIGKTLGTRVTIANDLAALTGTIQLDATKKGKSPALIVYLLKNGLVTKDEYVKLYKDLVEKHKNVIKYLKNASPEMRGSGGAARIAAKDMKGEFEMESIKEAKKYDIGSGYMGNGLTIWNRAEEENRDYKIIAHISPQGKLSIRDKQLPADLKKMFQIWADSMAKGNMGPKY